jgi:serine/threonine-protein kinase
MMRASPDDLDSRDVAAGVDPSPSVADESAQRVLPELPRAFGNYLLFDRIGRGGMAEIFLARTRNALGGSRRLVVKEVLPELSSELGFARMLIREAKLAARLRHRNVVQVLDLGRESNRLFIAMDYVEGFDLNQLLRQLSKRRLPLPAEFAILVVREVLQALDYAHRARDDHGAPLGIVHRDISPSNVLISFDGEVRLCDFGIARAMDMDLRRGARDEGRLAEELLDTDPRSAEAEESRIQRVRVAGKSAYMAPEHARGDLVDARSDLFATGILLWELCAGRRLYRGTDAEMLELARRGEVPPFPPRGLPASEQLQAILDSALRVDPASRYQSASEMLEALDRYALDVGLMASQLRFGTFLTDHFADEIVALRRARERAAEDALNTREMIVTEVEPVTLPSEPPMQRRSQAPSTAPPPEQRRAIDRDPPVPAGPSAARRTLVRAGVVTFVLGVAFTLYALLQ